MTSVKRQNTLFVAEDWTRVYEALENVDFRAYDQETIRTALRDYIRENYPDEYNDWIGSSEFVIKLDVLAWLSQSLSYRMDLNSRENFIATAERRASILRLAQNVAYDVNRVRAASGTLKITSISTTESVEGPDGDPIRGRVFWNDKVDIDWYEKFTSIMDAAFSPRTQFGRPLRRWSSASSKVESYRLNSLAPRTGTYRFSSKSSSGSVPMEVVNAALNAEDGTWSELAPVPGNAMHVLFKSDGLGFGSGGTGFFMPVKQGEIGKSDVLFDKALSYRTVPIDVPNVNNDDVWVTEVNADGTVVDTWTKVGSAFGEGVAFNTLEDDSKIFEVITRLNDTITIRFGDGKFGTIPTGRFRIWYRTSDPAGGTIKAADLRRTTIKIPYIGADTKTYILTLYLEATEDLSGAAPSETDAQIKTRANKVYYSQDRMVTNEDYNSYPLSDNSILKVKAVNRTFVGHGRNVLRDPTGTYNNVKALGEDGRLYLDFTSNTESVSADVSVLPIDQLITNYLEVKAKAADKRTLYYNKYPEISISEDAYFLSQSVVNGLSRGQIQRGDINNRIDVPVGDGADSDDELKHVRTDALVRFTDYSGPTARIDYTITNGMVTDGVLFKDFVTDGLELYSVFPAFRTTLSAAERTELTDKIALKRSFAIGWNHTEEAWVTILAEDIDKTSEFSLANQGDVTGAALDASWVIRLTYNSEGANPDTWTISERGMAIYFESDREIDFYYADSDPVIDSETGRSLRDTVKILKDNETRDSLARRGFRPAFGINPNVGAVKITGDGTTKTFPLNGESIDSDHLFVRTIAGLAVSTDEYTVDNVPGVDQITFDTAPALGTDYIAQFDPNSKRLTPKRTEYTGDDTNPAFDLNADGVHAENIWAFNDGLIKSPGRDFFAWRVDAQNISRIEFFTTPGTGEKLIFHALGGSGPAYHHRVFTADGATTDYSTLIDSSKVWVFVNGARVDDGWELIKTNPKNYIVRFDTAPLASKRIDVRVLIEPNLFNLIEDQFTATASQDTFQITGVGVNEGSIDKALCWVDGIFQDISYDDGMVFLASPLAGGEDVRIMYIAESASMMSGQTVAVDGLYEAIPTYLGSDVNWWVGGALLHSDGYTNVNGVRVTNVDEDLDEEADNPFLFKEIVLQDGDDKVLWRKVENRGHEEWDPIGLSTTPRGTYANSTYAYVKGTAYDSSVPDSSIHFDGTEWLIADPQTTTWIAAADQTAYKYEIGRGDLRFMWSHYSPDSSKIDPSPTNVNDMFILTSAYDTAVRSWLERDGDDADEPAAPTPEYLRATYGPTFAAKKMISDATVWRPASYKILFGSKAVAELQASIIIVRSPGSTVPDNDLKLRALAAIDDYFDPDNWDFGETFYFTQLSAYVHQELAPDIESIVIVPKASGAKFGRGFQVRAEPDELFISGARPDDVEVRISLTDTRLKIG